MPIIVKFQVHEAMEEVFGKQEYNLLKSEAESVAKSWVDSVRYELFDEPSVKLAQKEYDGKLESKDMPLTGMTDVTDHPDIPWKKREELNDAVKTKAFVLKEEQRERYLDAVAALDKLFIGLVAKTNDPKERLLQRAVDDKKVWHLVKKDSKLVVPTRDALGALARLDIAGAVALEWFDIRDGIRRELEAEQSAK